MVNPYRSPIALTRNTLPPPSPWLARVTALVLIWLACWFISVLSFYVQWGVLPQDQGEWWGYPLLTSPITLPASFGRVIRESFQWLPIGYSDVLAVVGAIAFWPCYITLLVLAMRIGRRKHFVFLGAMSLTASIYWHDLSVAASGI
jgi:hypothetical protein